MSSAATPTNLDYILPEDIYSDENDTIIKSKYWRDYFKSPRLQTPYQRLRLALSKKSYQYFLENIRELTLATFQIQAVQVIQNPEIQNKLFVWPREHGKSTLACEEFLAWYGSNNPYHYAIIFSETSTQAYKRGKQIKNIVETTPELTHLRQTSKENWGTLDFTFKNGFHVEMFGGGSGVAGLKYLDRRPDIIILDDVVPTTQGKASDESILNWYTETVGSLGGPDTVIIIIGTPYRNNDLIGKLLENKDIFHLRHEALLSKDIEAIDIDNDEELAKVETLWPEHWPAKRLRDHLRQRLQNNRLVFARQFLCRVIDPGTSLYPPSLIDYCKDPTLAICFSRQLAKFDYKYIILGNDLASSAEVGADYFVLYLLGMTQKNRFHLLWLERHKGLSFQKQKAIVLHFQERYQPNLSVIEKNGYQRVFAGDVSNEARYPVLAYNTSHEGKYDELVGLPIVKTFLGNRQLIYPQAPSTATQCTFQEIRNEKGDINVIVIPEGGPLIMDNIKIMFDEMTAWQWDAEKGVWKTTAEHDDTVMTQFFAIHGTQKIANYEFGYAGSMDSPAEIKVQQIKDNLNKFGNFSDQELINQQTSEEQEKIAQLSEIEKEKIKKQEEEEKRKKASLFDLFLPKDEFF